VKMRILTVITLALIVAAMMALNVSGPVAAKITTVATTTTTPCENPAGHQPRGQQPACQNTNALTQSTSSTAFATNPSGHRPPGQQP